MNKIYVYGTLRPNTGPTVAVPGTLYDLGWYPGIIMDGARDFTVQCEILEVDDERLAELDRYEGYREDDPEGSLYLRERYDDGWIYVYNHPVEGRKIVPEGDWRKYKELANV